MQRPIAFGLFRVDGGRTPVELLESLFQLTMDIAPFAHAWNRQEVFAAGFFHPALEQLPQLEVGEEIRALVGEARVALVGGRGALERPLARVLHR